MDNKITYEELLKEHEFAEDSVKTIVGRLQDGDHLLLYANHMFESSRFGEKFLVLAGPERTVPADNPPREIDPHNTGGLPSCRAQLVGEVDVEDVRKGIKQHG